jgi:hypothetical protein
MKNRWYLALAAGLALLAVAFMLGSMVRAQTGIPGDEDNPSGLTVQSEEPAVDINPPAANAPTGAQAEDLQLLEPGAVTIVNDVVQVQGRLTAPNGVPLNGNHTVAVSIYDSGGTPRCTDSDPVTVVDGLFTMSMDFCTAADFNGDALYMGIQVDADPEMTPRQEIFPVPYAWALRPGAIVKGADSYVFVPGNTLVKNLSQDTTRWDIQSNGAARIWRGATAGSKTVYFPIIIPAVLYGQNVTVEQMVVYYRVNNASNGYIDRTVLNVQTDADSFVNIIDDETNRTSTAASSYSITFTSNNVISSTQGTLSLFLSLHFADDTNYVDISAIRLRLGHQ